LKKFGLEIRRPNDVAHATPWDYGADPQCCKGGECKFDCSWAPGSGVSHDRMLIQNETQE
jgi:hypothetical protein